MKKLKFCIAIALIFSVIAVLSYFFYFKNKEGQKTAEKRQEEFEKPVYIDFNTFNKIVDENQELSSEVENVDIKDRFDKLLVKAKEYADKLQLIKEFINAWDTARKK
ncbi:hypothetical protein COBT_000354 [Conglomerata obtusa]